MHPHKELAHRSEDGREQTVLEHLEATAELCAAFANRFGAKEQGRFIGLAHDIGKCSDEFQLRLRGGKIVDHASAGALECAKAAPDAVWAAACVAGHHGGLQNVGNPQTDLSGDPTLFGRLRSAAEGKIPKYTMPLSLPAPPPLNHYGNDLLTDSFLTRMLYSCLVDADYLDTEQFMNGKAAEPPRCDSLSALLEKLEQKVAPWWDAKTDLNRERCRILRACMDGGSQPKGLFTLTVPTGGGKTIASMAFALRHAIAHGMDRIIYVIPYTSIIEQNAAVFRGIFGDENVVEHHSNAGFELSDQADESDYRKLRAVENWDAPIIVTTSVQFFESMYANRSSKCRKLHNIANSVLIFDEAQMLPPAHLRPCVAAIAQMVSVFGATAVLCTATQPVLNDLFAEYAPSLTPKELCPINANAFSRFRRVSFRNAGEISLESLTAQLSKQTQALCIVNSRASAREVYLALPEEGRYHLSTLMVPAHRRTVLCEIRQRLKGGLPCRVVSTSLIEAGVDVDFPAVWRELAGLDSILQAAGRCNREGKRSPEDSVVSVFSGVSKPPRLLEVNIAAAQEVFRTCDQWDDPAAVHQYFSAFRTLAGNRLDQSETVKHMKEGIAGCLLPFRTVAEEFHLIDSSTKTVYIPLGDGDALLSELLAGHYSRSLYRRLNQFSVNLYEPSFHSLIETGVLEAIDDDSAFLSAPNQYDPNTGLKLEISADPIFV